MNQAAHKNQYSKGANDNAAGVGSVLALAEYYSKNPPKRLRLGFLFTGAEETGTHGAKVFARQLAKICGKKFVVNLDMVGSGETQCFVGKEGSLFARRTDRKLNRLLMDVNPEMKSIQYLFRSGNFSPFIKLGIPATSIETTGSQEATIAYHSIFDDIHRINRRSLVGVMSTLIKFIDQLPYIY
ncbi:MAG: M28 family metallopeptidase [Anaerolineaceae bacterium]|nr:M28 family metallopeptidase [Anaerolineaceae bacterium]